MDMDAGKAHTDRLSLSHMLGTRRRLRLGALGLDPPEEEEEEEDGGRRVCRTHHQDELVLFEPPALLRLSPDYSVLLELDIHAQAAAKTDSGRSEPIDSCYRCSS